ncbi:hypothetical protein [Thermoactinomyces sp. DSM 45892]|uniref:hypothetical protein n=1 Tax=Thermoactinomyces sp. DSM 45892 TaxID=1882753 RepID=UPI0008948D68|nr:hypothetical protein [Thermoactinomyces sp. DSM 45892]SDX97155.1 hypothetical protein SAMN05444416_101135 [Thermoactinomyces sp. DSM 45892]
MPPELHKLSPPKNDLTGQTYGRITVLADGGTNNKGIRYWECQCLCGKVKIIRGSSFTSGKTRSCGCLNGDAIRIRKRVTDIKVGDRFGLLVTIERKSNTLWACICDCGGMKDVESYDLKRKKVKSCGCKKNKELQNTVQHYKRKKEKVGAHVPALKTKVRHNNSTGVKGVGRVQMPNGSIKYSAYLTINGTTHRAGYHDTIEDATIARKDLEEKYHRPFLENK